MRPTPCVAQQPFWLLRNPLLHWRLDVRKEVWYAGLALAVGMALGGCSSSDNNVTGTGGSGTVSFALTDAPPSAADSIVAAVFTISDIYLQKTDADSVSASNRVFLRQNVSTTVNLVALQDSLETIEQNATVPAGTYSQLRIVITGGYIQVKNADGTISTFATPGFALPSGVTATGTLQMPSFATSGLKVVFLPGGLTVTNGSTMDLVGDFDLHGSFGHAAGNSGMWVMSPVVRVVTTNSLATLTVNVSLGSGVTLPTGVALSGFSVQVTDAEGNTHTAPLVVAANGTASATFTNLLPSEGPFQVTLVGPTGVTFTATPTLPVTSVSLSAGATTTETITIGSAH